MTTRMRVKIAIDVAMTIGLLLQMGYMITGDLVHEIGGTTMLALLIVHNLFNRRWYLTLAKGSYPPRRIVDIVVTMLLLLSGVGIAVSAVILSSHVFRFLGIEAGIGFARILHMASVYWFFVLSSLHLGLHWSKVMRAFAGNTTARSSGGKRILLRSAVFLLSAFGIYAFIKHQIALYMFVRTQFVFFDFEQSPISFFFEYLCMMIMFATVSFYLSKILKKSPKGALNA